MEILTKLFSKILKFTLLTILIFFFFCKQLY